MKMNRIMAGLSILSLSGILLSGCQKQSEAELTSESIRQLAELATLEVHYNGVIKQQQDNADQGWWFGIGSKDLDFWMEYSGTAEYGVDLSTVHLSVNDGDVVNVLMEDAKVLRVELDQDFDEDPDAYIFAAKKSLEPTSEFQQQAREAARQELQERADADETFKKMARERAEYLIEDYIQQIGKLQDRNYTVSFQ